MVSKCGNDALILCVPTGSTTSSLGAPIANELMHLCLALLVPLLGRLLHGLLQLATAEERVKVLALQAENGAPSPSRDDVALSLAIVQER